MEQQGTSSNTAAGGPTQPETNNSQQQNKSPENDVKLSLLQPELLYVGFIGLFHNLSVLVFLLCYFIYWSVVLHHVIQHTKNSNTPPNSTAGVVVGFMVVHLIASLLAAGALVMDFFLREHTNPVKNRGQTIKTLQLYLTINMISLAFGVIMSIIIFYCVPIVIINPFQEFGLALSHCLRAACIFIAFRYLTFLGSGLNYWGGGGGYILSRKIHNQSSEKSPAEPPKEAQKV